MDFVTYEKFEKKMIEVLRDHEYEPDTDDRILRAFRVLDPERKGYLEAETMREILCTEGTPFREKEIEGALLFVRCPSCAAPRALLPVPPETIDRGSVSGLNRKECEHVQTMRLAHIGVQDRFSATPFSAPPPHCRNTICMLTNTPLHITPHTACPGIGVLLCTSHVLTMLMRSARLLLPCLLLPHTPLSPPAALICRVHEPGEGPGDGAHLLRRLRRTSRRRAGTRPVGGGDEEVRGASRNTTVYKHVHCIL